MNWQIAGTSFAVGLTRSMGSASATLMTPFLVLVLIAYKEGVSGKKDSVSQERTAAHRFGELSRVSGTRTTGGPSRSTTLCSRGSLGRNKLTSARTAGRSRHVDARQPQTAAANLCGTQGPLPDGPIHANDLTTLREVAGG